MALLEISLPSPPPRLAAQNSHDRSYVFFQNNTQRQINIYWMDFNGQQDLFTTLKPAAGIKADTFITHPWIFRDATTGERMHVKHQDIFWPQLYRVRHPQNEKWIPCRKLIAIHQPIQSLREICLWRFAELIMERCPNRHGKEALLNLNLPRNLHHDLESVLVLIEKHRNMGMRRR